jgi:CHAT domain-containing protein/Tfp pilus assembly protein PilF
MDGIRDLLQEGRYAEAEALSRESLAKIQTEYGAESLESAQALDLLVESLWRGGKAHRSETRELAEEAIRLKESLLEPDHAEVATSLGNLATVFGLMGNHAAARPLYERALRIDRAALGPDSPEVADDLAGLATLLAESGDYSRARSLFEEALAVMEKTAPDHPDLAFVQTVFANMLAAIGDYDEARSLYERALEIRRTHLGPEHPILAGSLNNLASLLYAQGDLEGAREYFERALAIREATLRPENSLVAATRHNLAVVLDGLGDDDKADALLEQAHDSLIETYGPDHPHVLSSQEALAFRHLSKGDHAMARALFERTVAAQERIYGARHPEVAWSLIYLTQFLVETGQTAEALEAALRAEEIGREHLMLTSRTLAEREALRYASTRTSGLGLALSLVEKCPGSDSRVRLWDAVIRSRALVLDETASRHRAARDAADPGIAQLWEELRSGRKNLADLAVRGPDMEHANAYRAEFERARRARERAERLLAEKSIAFRSERARRRIGFAEVAQRLPPQSALVAFVVHPDGMPSEKPSSAKVESVYRAFVLRKDADGPEVRSIGRASEIDGLVSRWKDEVSRGPGQTGCLPEEAEKSYREVGEELRRRIWDPIAPLLSGAELILVVPDGAVNLVSLATLPTDAQHYLVEAGPKLHYLSSERDLVPEDERAETGTGLLALGDPAFGVPARVEQGTAAPELSPPVTEESFPSRLRRCGNLRSAHFDSLPATRREVEDILDLWRSTADQEAVRLTGPGATEEAFETLAVGRRVIHLATHGFFLDGRCVSASQGNRGIGGLTTAGARHSLSSSLGNPLLLSGLVLAGANRREAPDLRAGNGVLTAEEIVALDLSGVEWAVLSACDTGVGVIQPGEGVLGLRRAFQVAGVSTLIMSLWSVEDDDARAWMHELYRARLGGLSTVEAVHRATLDALESRRQAGLPTHPSSWGAFVAAGDWR